MTVAGSLFTKVLIIDVFTVGTAAFLKPLGTVPRIAKIGFLRWFLFTSQLIMVYRRMTNAVRSVEMKKKVFALFGTFRAAKLHALRIR